MELVEPWWSPVLRSGKYFLAGTVAGTSDCLLNYPFDTVKSRLQTSPHHPLPGSISSSFTGPRDCFQRTVQNEGVMALYRGMSSSIVRTGLFSSITFGAYSHFKELFHVTDQNYVSLNMVCATTSTGFVESLICCPLELIKIRMQTQYGRQVQYTTWQKTQKIIQQDGFLRGLYRGFQPTFLREASGNVVYFGAYEVLKQLLLEASSSWKVSTPERDTRPLYNRPVDMTCIALAGGLAGVCYWTLAFPFDTIKSVIQAETNLRRPKYPSSILGVASKLMQEQGLARLYRGITPTLIKAFTGGVVTFVMFENCLQCLSTLE